MKAVWVLIAGCLLAIPSFGGKGIEKETIEIAGKTRRYYLYVPASLPKEGPVPLLLTFHGSGRDGRSLVEKWTRLADREGFVVAGLDATDKQAWSFPEDGPNAVKVLVEALRARFPVDGRRVYVFGHSAGAVFGLKLGLLESEYFAAVAVHAGSFRDAQEYSVLPLARRKVSLKIIVGDRDNFFPISSVNATVKALEEQAFPVDLEVIRGHDHWYYDRAQQLNEKAWTFLKEQRLPAEPTWVEYRIP